MNNLYLLENKLNIKIIPLFCGLLALVLGFFVLYPNITNIITNLSELQKNQAEIAERSNYLVALQTLPAGVYRDQLDLALKALPQDKDFLVVSALLQKFSTEADLKIGDLGFSDSGASSDSFSIRLEVVGSLNAFKNFIDKVNSSPRQMKVTSFELTNSRSALIQGSISLLAYTQALPKKVDQKNSFELTETEKNTLNFITKTLNSFQSIFFPGLAKPTGKQDPFTE